MIALAAAALTALAQEPPRDEGIVVEHVGYLDIGFFDAAGDGVAYQRDRPAFHDGVVDDPGALPHPSEVLPDGAPPVAWVFFGDPWANSVNSQGQSADLGLMRNPIQRVDTLQSGGRPTVLVNRFHYGIQVDRGDKIGLRARVNLDPRQGQLGSVGDVLSLDVAYLLWHPKKDADVAVYVGRIESGFGTEYVYRRAPMRFGITPSLTSRYTVGRQTGARVRGTALRWFDYSVSLTSGSSVDEGFGHFSDELDSNSAPTVTARLGAHNDGIVRLSGGLSGEFGARDGQPDPMLPGWQMGVDAMLEVRDLVVRVDATTVNLPAGGPGNPEFLRAHGGTVEAWFHMTNHFGPLLRLDWRDAVMRVEDNLYLSNVLRLTVGCRADLDYNVILKAEYLHLRELEGPELVDDVFTTSLVFRY